MINQIKVVQVSKINLENSFIFNEDKSVGFPMEPLISTEVIDCNILKVRIAVFIDKDNEMDPYVEVISETDDTLNISIKYNYKEEKPLEYNCYYLEIDYTSDSVTNIKKINSKLIDIDPRTSRGTVTEVAH
jgi:hypothetical protein